MHSLDPRLLRRARAARVLLAADAAIGVLAGLLVLAQAVLLARIAARGFGGAPLAELTLPLVLLVAVIAVRAVAMWAFEVAGRRAAADVMSELRLELVECSLRDRPTAVDRADSGEVATTAVGGIDALEALFARYLPQVALATIVPVAVIALVAWLDPLSAGIMLLTLPLVPVFMWLIGRYTERRTQARRVALSQLANHFLDVVRGLPTLRAFNRADQQAERIARVSDQYRRATMGTLRVTFLSGAVLELAATLGIALVAVTVGVRLVEGGIGFEPALIVLVLAPELYLPLRNLGAQYHASADGLAIAGRMLDLIDAPRLAPSGALPAPSPGRALVRLEGVSFSYPSRPVAVLDAVDLELEPGISTALVGPSGAGKSTVASLILRLVEPSRGRVTAGGIDLAECDPAAWRAQIAWVPQEPTLFRGTVADNIGLGRADADREQVRAAAELAGADGFIRELPRGYATLIGDGGRPVSAGQRQRIALARALVRDAPLLVLDEPAANLDLAAARLVADAIDGMRGTRTILVIAHRPELAARADRIVRLDPGRPSATPVAA